MLALPAKAIVKLRPGNVFEALQSCCLAFCNVLLVWLAPGLLLACSWLAPGLPLACLPVLPGALQVPLAGSWLAPGLLFACFWLVLVAPGLLLACPGFVFAFGPCLLLACVCPVPGLLLACSWVASCFALGLLWAWAKPGASQEQARSEPHQQYIAKCKATALQGFKNTARAQLYDCFRWQGQHKTSNHKVGCAE